MNPELHTDYSRGYITLDAPISGLPGTLKLDAIAYHLKSEFHCSLVAVKYIIPQLMQRDGLSQAEAEETIIQAAFGIINDLKPTIISIGPELRIAEHPDRDRHTVIALAKVAYLDEIFARLNEQLGLALPTQVAHVTLFAKNGAAIGIPSPADLDRLTRPLTPAEARQWNAQVKPNKLTGASL